MRKPITAFLANSGQPHTRKLVADLQATGLVDQICLLTAGPDSAIPGCEIIRVDSLASSRTIQQIAEQAAGAYVLLQTQDCGIDLAPFALQRFVSVAQWSSAAWVYSDFVDLKQGKRVPHPVTDYQLGSIRDDFNFGPLVLIQSAALRKAARELSDDHRFAGLYAARLALSRAQLPLRIAEPLYTKVESDLRKTGEKQFDYVDPRNRAAQIEMEHAATEHLKKIGCYLPPQFDLVEFDADHFATEASVIIPVRNRVKTLPDAIASALSQKTDFSFNVIVVDNHSTDGTTHALREIAQKDPRLIHHVPQRNDLGIGGCWNEGVHHPAAGRFVCQLDSDDLYKDHTTLQQIVDLFREERVAMVIGSYQMVNFDLQEIPPGVIDHREWTPENGRNNALRINGLGAPRCFYTPILRKTPLPNVSYGEDYAVALAISRDYQIGRIYEPIYLCRRWDGNSDADLDVNRFNTFNAYKDKIRSLEMMARMRRLPRVQVKLARPTLNAVS